MYFDPKIPSYTQYTWELWIGHLSVYDALVATNTFFSNAFSRTGRPLLGTLIDYYPSATDSYLLAPFSSFDPSTLIASYIRFLLVTEPEF